MNLEVVHYVLQTILYCSVNPVILNLEAGVLVYNVSRCCFKFRIFYLFLKQYLFVQI